MLRHGAHRPYLDLLACDLPLFGKCGMLAAGPGALDDATHNATCTAERLLGTMVAADAVAAEAACQLLFTGGQLLWGLALPLAGAWLLEARCRRAFLASHPQLVGVHAEGRGRDAAALVLLASVLGLCLGAPGA